MFMDFQPVVTIDYWNLFLFIITIVIVVTILYFLLKKRLKRILKR